MLSRIVWTSFFGALGAAALILTLAGSAHAISVTSSGTWSNPTGTAANVNGVGTDTISWGNSTGSGQSSWVFSGVSDNLGTDFEGDVFKLGTFTHDNNPIRNYNFTGADLSIDLQIVNGTTYTQSFDFTFGHLETPNRAPCNPAGSPECPDVVTIPLATAHETLLISGQAYNLTIVGFSDSPGGSIVTQFITDEKKSNRAMLYGSLSQSPIPEPSAALLFAVGALVVGRSLRRKALS